MIKPNLLLGGHLLQHGIKTNPNKNMNRYEQKAYRLSMYALVNVERTTDVMVYRIVAGMCDIVNQLHFTAVDKQSVEDAVLGKLEQEGIEVCY